MTIEFKFNIGDTIYFIAPSLKVCHAVVRGIKVYMTDDHIKDESLYLCNDDPTQYQLYIKVEDKNAFKSKEELLKSL